MTAERHTSPFPGRTSGRQDPAAAVSRAAKERDRALARLRRLTVAAAGGAVVLAGVFAALAAAATGGRSHDGAAAASAAGGSPADAARAAHRVAISGPRNGAGADGFYAAAVAPPPEPAPVPPSSSPLPSDLPPVAVSGGS